MAKSGDFTLENRPVVSERNRDFSTTKLPTNSDQGIWRDSEGVVVGALRTPYLVAESESHR